MADTIEIVQGTATVVEVAGPTGPQGPAGASQADVLTQPGDMLYRSTVAARLPIGTAGQILKVNAGATAPEWGAAPASGVSSVAGRTGDVTLAKADVGLGNVDNTSDANKPVSTATQTALDAKAATSDSRLTDSREWSADTISQAEAEAGTATTRRAFTALRVFQAIAAWWAGSSAKTKLDGIASGATANATDAQLRDRSTHTGTQPVGTITGLAAIATSGSASDLASNPTFVGDAVINGPSTGVSGSLKVGNTTGIFNCDVELNSTGLVIQNTGSTGTTTIAKGNGGTLSYTLTPPNASGTIALAGAITTSGLTQSTARILGRTTASTGAVEEITIGSGLSLSAGQLSATASGGATNLWIPASAFIPKTTAGCGVDSRETTTNDQNFDELLFDAGSDEFADALVVMPSNYNNGTITARFYWTAASGSGDVIWAIQGRAFANDDALDTAAGTAQTVTDTLIAANDMHVSGATSAVTIGGTPAANTPIQFTVYRDANAAGDSLAVDARFLGCEIVFN